MQCCDVYNSKFVSQKIYDFNTVDQILKENTINLDKFHDNIHAEMKDEFQKNI